MKKVRVDSVTISSLYVEAKLINDEGKEFVLSNATAFTVKHKGFWYLVTNWHVVTGKNPETDLAIDTKTCALPNVLSVHFRSSPIFANRKVLNIPLSSDNPCWVEHKTGRKVDVVAIPIDELEGVTLQSVDLESRKNDMAVAPGLPVSIIGYPYGLWSGPAFAIWKTGTIASDVDIDCIDGRSAFLIDASTRSGMSGSPVIMRSFNGYHTPDNRYVMGGVTDKFLGIYSGRLKGKLVVSDDSSDARKDDSDVGMVWRSETLIEILNRVGRIGDKWFLIDE